MKIKRILIEGIGGIGGLVAARLIKNGYNVTLVTHNKEITNEINTNGIRIKEGQEQIGFQATAHTHLDEVPKNPKYNMIFLIMKSTEVETAARDSLSLLSKKGYMATFQNGIVEDRIEKIIGEGRVVPVTVGFGGTMISPGVYEKTSQGGFHIGELHSPTTKRVMELKTILETVDKVVVSDEMRGVLWSKLAINCTINTLGAITGNTLGELLSQRRVRKLFLQLYSEVVEVANAKNIKLETISGNPYRFYLPPDANPLTKLFKDIFLIIVGRKYKNLRSSTLQSIERGRKSEIDVLNGYVTAQGELLGIKTPANRSITEIMHLIDDGKLTYREDNLNLLIEKLNLPN